MLRPGQTINVTSPLKAAEVQMDVKWPADPDLPKQRRARAAVLKALKAARTASGHSPRVTHFRLLSKRGARQAPALIDRLNRALQAAALAYIAKY